MRDLSSLIAEKLTRQRMRESVSDRTSKRISYTTEFDNGHVLHNDWRRVSIEDAEELARQKSLEDPNKIFYVQYDDIMNPSSDNYYKNGKLCDYKGNYLEESGGVTGYDRDNFDYNKQLKDEESSHPYVGRKVRWLEDGRVYRITGAYDDSRGTIVRCGDITMRPDEYRLVKESVDSTSINFPSHISNREIMDLIDELGYDGAVEIRGNTVYGDETTIRQLRRELDNDMYMIDESNESAPNSYYKKVEDILNHRLGSYETGVSVENIDIISETPGTITLKVDYEVHIQIPMVDPEDKRTYYETDSEYRTQTMTFDFDELDEDLTLDDDPEETEQQYSSAATSINSSKLPALFSMVDFEKGSINLDYGGGRFDNVAEYLQDKYGATNLVYDKYNRSADHNRAVLEQIRKNGGADTVTCSNVLNVIAEESERLAVLRNCKRYLKSGGTCYITVYEGNGKGEGAPTKSGYQLNRKTKDYEDEIKKVFSSVTRKGKLFICR